MGSGFFPSSTGDSPPAPSSVARGPSVTFAPGEPVGQGSSFASYTPPPVIPASRMVSLLPWTPPAHPVTALPPAQPPPVIPVLAPPPAEPPPPTLLPLIDFSLSCSHIHHKGSLFHTLLHDGPVSPLSPFDRLPDSWDTPSPALLHDSSRGPCPVGSVHRVTSNPRVFGFQGGG